MPIGQLRTEQLVASLVVSRRTRAANRLASGIMISGLAASHNFIRCLALVGCVLVARAQSKNERYLNVVASDSKGAPITDLTSADFQIFDDGKVQQITSFQASAKQQSRAAIPPTILIVFDLLNAIPSQRAYTSTLIVRALESLEESDSLYLYILTNQGSLYPIHPLPASRPTLLLNRTVEGNEHEQAHSAPWTRQIRSLMDQAAESVVRMKPRDLTDLGTETGITYRTLAALGAQLSRMRGPKTIIWITRGAPNYVPYPFGCQNVEFAGESGNYLAGKCSNSCANIRASNECIDYTPFLEHFSSELDRSDTIFSSVEQTGGELSTDTRGSRTDTLQRLANFSGGRRYPSGDIKNAITQSLQGARGRYQLAYQAPQPDGRYHGVHVACGRKGVRIQAQQGYYTLVKQP